MNTPMPPPQEPLDAQERELARILHALPGGEPPAALDAKILRAATNAAAGSRRPGARLLASAGALWGIGSAAAAVLALGVAWQLRYGEPDRAPAAASAPRAQAVSDVAEDEAVQVEFGARREVVKDMPPPPAELAAPPAAAAPAPSAPRMRQLGAAADSAPPSPPPPAAEPFAQDQLDEHVAREAAANAAEAKAEMRSETELAKERDSFGYARDAAAKSASPAAQAASAAPAPASAAQSRADLGAVSATGGLVAPTDAPPSRPATWLAEVRRLRDEGKIAEARARLVEFRRAYPKWVIPTDLAPLLTE